MSEHQEQSALFRWAAINQARVPEMHWMFAIPNGGHRHPAVAGKLRAEGVKPGVPDICLPVARHGFHGLYIEMKAPGGRGRRGGRVNDKQGDWHTFLRVQGYQVEVCVGWEAAAQVIANYVGSTFSKGER